MLHSECRVFERARPKEVADLIGSRRYACAEAVIRKLVNSNARCICIRHDEDVGVACMPGKWHGLVSNSMS